MKAIVGVVACVVLLCACAEDEDAKAKRNAAAVAISAIERTVPEGVAVEFNQLTVIPNRYGAVCGLMRQANKNPERFWVGGTDGVGGGNPIRESWSEDKKENEHIFASYCKGMTVIPDSLFTHSSVGKESEADRRKSQSFDKMVEERREPTAEERRESDRRSKLIDERFNANAKAQNKRIKEAYERGVQVCRNLASAGRPPGNGCPRPAPTYTELR